MGAGVVTAAACQMCNAEKFVERKAAGLRNLKWSGPDG